MKKADLRKVFIEKRNSLSIREYSAFNEGILAQFQKLDFSEVKAIHLYLPIYQKKEPDTFLIRNWLKQNHSDIQRIFPKADFKDYSIANFLDDDALVLEESQWGIPEPITGTPASLNNVGMVLVPLLAFDLEGYRVGYGKGFYDRFLKQFPATTQFIGLSLFDPVDAISDCDEFDIPLHCIITPSKIWQIKR